jgi:isopenicillin-N epimerase
MILSEGNSINSHQVMSSANISGKLVNYWQQHWLLDRQITFLNHGSFGACPQVVLAEQQRLRSQLELDPVRFFMEDFEPLLDRARDRLAHFVGANPQDLVFVPNATTGVNTVLRSLHFHPGDEILTTDHTYNACRNALNVVGDIASATLRERENVQIVVASVPFPLESPDQIIEAVMQKVSPQTKLVLLDHATSQTGLIFPIQKLISQLTKLGIDTLVDGAQAPGMVSLDLSKIGATYYTGNCHKWLLSPKGAGFLYIRSDRQSQIRPLAISNGTNSPRTDRSKFHLEFDWIGTDDPTAYLSVPTAINFIELNLKNGWNELMQRNHQLAVTARKIIAETLGVALPCPDTMIGAMASIPLPHKRQNFPPEQVQSDLYDRARIQVPIFYFWPTQQWIVRISAQLYNTEAQYEKLAQALQELLGI